MKIHDMYMIYRMNKDLKLIYKALYYINSPEFYGRRIKSALKCLNKIKTYDVSTYCAILATNPQKYVINDDLTKCVNSISKNIENARIMQRIVK